MKLEIEIVNWFIVCVNLDNNWPPWSDFSKKKILLMEKNTTAGLGKSPVHFRRCGSDQVRPSFKRLARQCVQEMGCLSGRCCDCFNIDISRCYLKVWKKSCSLWRYSISWLVGPSMSWLQRSWVLCLTGRKYLNTTSRLGDQWCRRLLFWQELKMEILCPCIAFVEFGPWNVAIPKLW